MHYVKTLSPANHTMILKYAVVYSAFMKKFLLSAVIITGICSCKEKEVQASDTLISHKWSPTQARIVTIDTTSIITFDTDGKMHTVSNSFRLDTTYNLETCIQQSTYSFLQNGVLQVTNPCETGQPTTDTPWAIGPNRFLEIYLIDDTVSDVYYSRFFAIPTPVGPSANSGGSFVGTFLTKFNASEFYVDQKITGSLAFQHYVNGLMVDSVVNIITDKFITFTSR